MKKLFLVSLLVSTLIGGCAWIVENQYGIRTYNSGLPKTISNGNMQLTVENCSSGDRKFKEDYFMRVIIKNTGSKPATFDSAELELTDDTSGLSFYSVSKDAELVSVPESLASTILKRTLNPGRSTSGLIWFVSGPGRGVAKKLTLKWGTKKLSF